MAFMGLVQSSSRPIIEEEAEKVCVLCVCTYRFALAEEVSKNCRKTVEKLSKNAYGYPPHM